MDKQITERDIEIDVKGLKVRGTLCSPQSDTKNTNCLNASWFYWQQK